MINLIKPTKDLVARQRDVGSVILHPVFILIK